MQYVKQLIEERDALAAQIAGMAEQATTEQRGLTDSENASIDGMKARIDSLDTELRRWDGFGKAVKGFTRIEDAAVEQREARQAEQRTERRSWGDIFTESRAFADYSGYGSSGKVEVPSLVLEQRAPILTTTDLGAEYLPERVPGYGPLTRTTLWDAIAKINVSDGSIQYPVYSKGSDAAVVPEGTLKPDMTWTMEMVEKVIPTLAHKYEYSRQWAQDKIATKSVIDSELVNGVRRKLNSQAAAAVAAVATPAVTGATLLEAIRKAQAAVEGVDDGYYADALLINPADAADIDLALLSATMNGAAYGAPVFGLRVIRSNAVTAGKPVVLSLDAVRSFVRTGVDVFVSDSNKDNFEKNMMTAIAEARALTVVQRPELVVPATVAAAAAARAK